jgi:hypothetical protein
MHFTKYPHITSVFYDHYVVLLLVGASAGYQRNLDLGPIDRKLDVATRIDISVTAIYPYRYNRTSRYRRWGILAIGIQTEIPTVVLATSPYGA